MINHTILRIECYATSIERRAVGRIKKIAFRSAEIGLGAATLLYAASTADALIDHDYEDAKIQATETGKLGLLTALTVGTEVYLKNKQN